MEDRVERDIVAAEVEKPCYRDASVNRANAEQQHHVPIDDKFEINVATCI